MLYKSTRSTDKKSSTYALLKGLAGDGGLYVPEHLPQINVSYEKLKNLSYQEIAEQILQGFFPDLSQDEIKTAVNSAYNNTNFTTEQIVPLHKLNDQISFGELFHGRTLAFKDLALSLFPYLLLLAKNKENEKRTILILAATSGDTGKAALEGFKDVDGINIVVFYPENGVSRIQEEQMRKQKGKNVQITAIKGNFDDAQGAIKTIFADEDFQIFANENNITFSSANSINIGRLFPQVIYYITTYINLIKNNTLKENEEFNVVVPTGNFGNVLAAYIAKKLGVPIHKLIVASNKNDILVDFFNTGCFDKNRLFHTTESPSMDVLISSNFERFLYYFTHENADRINELMNDLKNDGKLRVTKEELEGMKKEFYAESANDEETIEAIKKVYDENHYLMDPHTSVGYVAYQKYLAETNDSRHTVIMATAHPFKFPSAVSKALSIELYDDAYKTLDEISSKTGVLFPEKLTEIRNSDIIFSETIEKETIGEFVKNYIKKIK